MAKKSSKSANTFVNGVYGIKMNGGVTTKSGKQVTYDSSASDVTDMCEFEGRVPDNSHSFWYATMDVNYIYLAFSDTYNAIKNAKEKYGAQFNYTVEPSLIYNDYSSYSTNTQIGLARWVNAAANAYNDTEDVMYCTGIGVQAHEGVGSNHEAMIKTYVESGFEVQITELDVGCKSGTGTWNYDGQASAYKRLYQTYMKYSGNEAFCKERGLPGVTSVTQWGLRDGDGSWRSDEAPYVFEPYTGTDKNLTIQPKPAFYAIFQAAGLDVGEKEY